MRLKQIPNFPAYSITPDGRVWSYVHSRWLEQSSAGGYHVVKLQADRRYHKYVHRLILETYAGPCPADMQACHNNGIRDDNRLENLRWDTCEGNQRDRVKHGTSPQGEQNGRAKLTEMDVYFIRAWLDDGYSNKDLAAIFGVRRVHIWRIKIGKLWARLK